MILVRRLLERTESAVQSSGHRHDAAIGSIQEA
jgi:hypothetical protein